MAHPLDLYTVGGVDDCPIKNCPHATQTHEHTRRDLVHRPAGREHMAIEERWGRVRRYGSTK